MTISGPPARSRWPTRLGALALAALAVGIALRVSLAVVNAEANDPHRNHFHLDLIQRRSRGYCE